VKRALPEEKVSIEWTPANILLILLASLVLVGGIAYGLGTAKNDLNEKRERLLKLTLNEVGTYILEHNSGTTKIDTITTMRGMSLDGKVMEIPYYVSEGFLHKVNQMMESTERTKRRVQRDLLNEDCSKTAFSVFMQKGGIMHYTYRLEKAGESIYLFDFNNTRELCD